MTHNLSSKEWMAQKNYVYRWVLEVTFVSWTNYKSVNYNDFFLVSILMTAAVDGWNIYSNDQAFELLVFQNIFEILQGEWKYPIQNSGACYSKNWKKKQVSSHVQWNMLQ